MKWLEIVGEIAKISIYVMFAAVFVHIAVYLICSLFGFRDIFLIDGVVYVVLVSIIVYRGFK
jgi:hypothetical protein